MKNNLFILAAAALLPCACSKDAIGDAATYGENEKITVVSAGTDLSRTAIDGDNGTGGFNVRWSEGDILNINGTASDALTADEAGDSYASFRFTDIEAPYYAVYPSSVVKSFDASGTAVVTLADEQVWSDGNWPEGSAVLVGTGTDTGEGTAAVTLKNVCSFIKINISGEKRLKKIVFRSNTVPVRGDFAVDFENNTLVPVAAADVYNTKLALDCSAVTETGGSYIFAIPAQEYKNGFSVMLVSEDDLYMRKSVSGAFSAKAGDIRTMNDRGSDFTAFEPTDAYFDKGIYTADDYAAFAAAATAGDYSEWQEADGSVNLCADIETDGYFLRIQSTWDGVFDGHNHIVRQGNSRTPLFSDVSETGVIRNLVLEGVKTSAAYPDTYGTAAVARISSGTIENIVNRMEIDMKELDGTTRLLVGGIAIGNAGVMRNCIQEGDIRLDYTLTANKPTFIGGVSCIASSSTTASAGSAGKFYDCINKGDISVVKSSAANQYLSYFALGGICGVVHCGTADNYSLFENCSNEGCISRRDDSHGAGTVSCIGGIVGRVGNVAGGGAAVDLNAGHYVEFIGCSNSGTVENGAYLTNTFASNLTSTISGARWGYTGGIVGIVRGADASMPARISDCVNMGTVKAGHHYNTFTVGGIVGLTSYADITGCTAVNSFGDAEIEGVALKCGAVGGIVGSVHAATKVSDSKAYATVDMQAALNNCGLCGGALIPTSGTAPVLTVENSKFGGSFSYSAGTTVIAVDADNYSDYVGSFGNVVQNGVSYWNGL